MTELIRKLSRRPRAILAPLLSLAIVALAGLAIRAAARPEARTIALEARDMAFYAGADPTPNPTLVAERGELLRLELRNRDRGMAHDLAFPALERHTGIAQSPDEIVAVQLRAPDEPGDYAYVCSLHSRMMRGTLTVR
jgi:cupredoxin-like protein